MLYRTLGNTGLRISELSYGAARGMDNREQFNATLRAAIDAGINFIDTAPSYGDSEVALGEALREINGSENVIIETKYRPYDSHDPKANYIGSPAALIASAEDSLRRLKRDRLDILLGHGLRTTASLDRFMNEGCFEAMLNLRKQGKVRYVGISELSEGDGTHEVLRRAIPSGKLDVVMLTINFLLQTAVESVLPLCKKFGVGPVVMMPLNQASTTSGLVSVPAALECVRRHVAQGNLPNEEPYTRADLLEFLQPYSVPEAAIRYVLSHEVSTCCVGFRTTARLAENLRAVEPPYLDAARMERLRSLFGRIRAQER